MQHFYDIHWPLPRPLSWINSVLLTWKILGLLVNTLPANEKYPVLNKENLIIPIQMQFSQKQKVFSQVLPTFLKSKWNFKYFEKKDDLHRFCISEITGSENVLRFCVKSAVSEDSSTSNMVNLPKHCWNLRHSTFVKYIDHCQVNWVGKSLSYWKEKSCDYLLTYWLPMTSILFLMNTI